MSDSAKSDQKSSIIVTFDKSSTKDDSVQLKQQNPQSQLQSQSPFITPEVERNVREFSRCTALYTMLIISIGTLRDSGKLRDDISTVRQRGWELANYNKSLLVPRMRQASGGTCPPDASVMGNSSGGHAVENSIESYKNLERVFFMFCSCLEFFMEQLLRTVDLLASFQLTANGVPDLSGGTFVNSGLTDSMPGCLYLRAATSSISASPLSSPVPSTTRRHSAFNFRFNAPRLKQHQKQHALLGGDRSRPENQELLLKKDIKAIKDLILEIHSSIAMTPWTIQPQYHLERFQGNSDSLASLADSSDEAGIDSARSSTCKYAGAGGSGLMSPDKGCQINATKRRCIIVTISVLVSTIIFAITLGVCIRLFV